MAKIIILNGPPRCGKDTAAEAVENHFTRQVCLHTKLSYPLKAIVEMVTGVSFLAADLSSDAMLPVIGMSYRDAQIHTYNQLSPVFGTDWLGKALVHDIHKREQEFFIVSDGGRTADITSLLTTFQPENILIVQIMREGCNFTNDIRSYISAPNVVIKPILNEGIEAFVEKSIDIAGEFFAN